MSESITFIPCVDGWMDGHLKQLLLDTFAEIQLDSKQIFALKLWWSKKCQ